MRSNGGVWFTHQPMCPNRHQGIQTEQCRRGAQNGQIGPLPLGLDTEMLADLLKGRLNPPTEHEAAEDRHGFEIEIGAKKRLGVARAGWIADQDPANRGPEGIDVP